MSARRRGKRGPDVLDASALLAFLQGNVEDDALDLQGAVLNAVSLAEVVRSSVSHGADTETLLEELLVLGLDVAPFGPEEGLAAGRLAARLGHSALSFGELACLATARVRRGTAVTATAGWEELGIDVPVRVVG